MPGRSNYDKFPVVQVSENSAACVLGWTAIGVRIDELVRPGKFVVCVECYPGCFQQEIERELSRALQPKKVIQAEDVYKPAADIERLVARDLTDDPVFGRMNNYELRDFLDDDAVRNARREVADAEGLVLVIGTGATVIAEQYELLVYADMARWEIQLRQRKNEIANLGLDNSTDHASLKY